VGVLYMPFFDMSLLPLGTFTLEDHVNEEIVIDLDAAALLGSGYLVSSSIFSHGGSALLGYYSSGPLQLGVAERIYPEFSMVSPATLLQTLIRTEATALSYTNPNGFTVVFNKSTARYTIAHPTVATSYLFNAAEGRRLFGMPASGGPALSHVGTKTPNYVVNAALPDVAEESLPNEPDGIANHITADNGRGTGIAREVAPLHKNWVQPYEPKLKTLRILGVQPDNADDPFTHQHLYEHCRGEWPFVLDGVARDGDTYGVAQIHSLRNDGLSFTPVRETPGSGNQFSVPYRTVFEGVIDGVLV
jgi:hypothetical protein